jgi:hypothetical protein
MFNWLRQQSIASVHQNHATIPRSRAFQCELLEDRVTPATYFVDDTGGIDALFRGEIGTPFRTINYGIQKLNPGDTLNVRAGTYNERVWVDRSGTATAPIRIQGYQNEVPKITGNNTGPGGTSVGQNVRFPEINNATHTGVSHVVFRNFEVTQNTFAFNKYYNSAAVLVEGSGNGVAIQDLYIHDVGRAAPGDGKERFTGILIAGGGDTARTSTTISGNRISNMDTYDGNLIWATGRIRGITIHSNTLSKSRDSEDGLGWGISLGSGINGFTVADTTVARNDSADRTVVEAYVYGNTLSEFGNTMGGIYTTGGRSIQIYGNKISGVPRVAIGIGAERGNDVTINNKVYNNLAWNVERGIEIGAPSKTHEGYATTATRFVQYTQVYSNTFVQKAGSTNSVLSFNKNDFSTVVNNIFQSTSGVSISQYYDTFDTTKATLTTNLHLNFNLYFDTKTSLPTFQIRFSGMTGEGATFTGFPAWKLGTGYDGNSLNTTPGFVNAAGGNFHILSTSKARNAGNNNFRPTYDIDGQLRSASPIVDIGADEYIE